MHLNVHIFVILYLILYVYYLTGICLSFQMSVSPTVFEHSYVRLLIYYILYDDLTFVCWYQTFLLPTYFIGKNHCIKSFAVFKPIAVFLKIFLRKLLTCIIRIGSRFVFHFLEPTINDSVIIKQQQ